MDDLAEQCRQLGADALAGRIRICEVGVARLEFDELALAGVVLSVGHRRRIVPVVLHVVAVDQTRQLPHALEITLGSGTQRRFLALARRVIAFGGHRTAESTEGL